MPSKKNPIRPPNACLASFKRFDRITVMKKGRIVDVDAPQDLLVRETERARTASDGSEH